MWYKKKLSNDAAGADLLDVLTVYRLGLSVIERGCKEGRIYLAVRPAECSYMYGKVNKKSKKNLDKVNDVHSVKIPLPVIMD